MATTGESSSSTPNPKDDKPVIVRVKRKAIQSRLDAFWLEINERPLKRPVLDFEKLSLSESSGKELKAKKVFVRHVETVTTSDTTVDIVQTFMPHSADVHYSKTKAEERSHSFKKENIHEQNLSRARQQHEVLAKTARFEQIWRRRKGNKEEHDKAVHEMCHFYDIVRLDEERSSEVQKQEDMSLEDSRLLASYLPMLREFLPSSAAEIESDLHAYMSTQQDDYLYDYYTVKDDMNVDDEDASNPFPRVQVDDEDFNYGLDESDYDSEDSNAEDNPRNDYPDEISEGEEEEEEEEGESKASDDSEEESESGSHNAPRDLDLYHEDEFFYDDLDEDGIHCDYYGSEDNGEDRDGEDWRWSYR